jgi:hypothetical protein
VVVVVVVVVVCGVVDILQKIKKSAAQIEAKRKKGSKSNHLPYLC